MDNVPVILEIVKWPDDRLKQVCKRVEPEEFKTEEFQHQVDSMIETMYANKGIGLAANQVGFNNRVIVIAKDPRPGGKPGHLVIVNPKITNKSVKQRTGREGCLSVPNQFAIRRRPSRVTVLVQNQDGSEYTWQGRGLQSACIFHEIDHLNGKIFLER